MSLDDAFLSLQNAVDRVVRRLRLGRAPARTRRRFLIIQIDGLSRAVLERALAEGRMPFLKRLLGRHRYRLQPMSVGLPTSTPAFQMAAMYGVRPDIPGFHYHDKRRRRDFHFPRAGHAAVVERDHSDGRVGILRGGSTYGCIFTGSADNNLFSFTTLHRPTADGILRVLSAFVVLMWVLAKGTLHTVIELGRALLRLIADPINGRHGWRWLSIKIGVSLWVREFFTLAVSRDVYAGVPAIYVNYLDYDVAAHAFGPASRHALRSLRRVDRSIHRLWRVIRRVPEHRYDLYVLSDHGQAHCRPFPKLTGGKRLERYLFDEFLGPKHAGELGATNGRRPGFASEVRAYRRSEKGLLQRFVNYLGNDFPLTLDEHEAHEQGGIRVIAAGPNAFVYVVDTAEPVPIEILDKRFPGLAEDISRSVGVGFVLARSDAGPVCFWRGQRYQLNEKPGPFAARDDTGVVLRGISDLMAMPSAGDLVIYGIGAPEGDVSFIPEIGAHAGPSREELHTFIVHPAGVDLPALIDHPVQLYDHFIRYQEPP